MSSDIVVDTPKPSQMGAPRLQVNKPGLYYGDRNKLESWILQFDRHFHVEGNRIEEADKVVLATTYMRGDAEKWVTPIIRKYMDDAIVDASNTALVENWSTFKERLRQIFSPIQKPMIAEQKIQRLKHIRSVADYTILFQHYAEPIRWDNIALTRMYKQGLKLNVRAELMRSGSTITTPKVIQDKAIRLDNEFYRLELESLSCGSKNSFGGSSSRTHKPNRRTRPNEGWQRYPNRQDTYKARLPGSYSGYGPEAMHIDNLNKGKEWKNKVRNYPTPPSNKADKKDTTCYGCGKQGHYIRNCRSKNKVYNSTLVIYY